MASEMVCVLWDESVALESLSPRMNVMLNITNYSYRSLQATSRQLDVMTNALGLIYIGN